MTIVAISLVVVFFLVIYLTKDINTPFYKKTSLYKGLVGEDKLKIDLTLMLEKVVETSLRISKENDYSLEITNLMLTKDIDSIYGDLTSPTKAYGIASKYKVPLDKTISIIHSTCQGALGTYVLNK